MRPRSLLRFDVWLFSSTITLAVIGVLFIYSSGVSSTGVLLSTEYVKQIIWAALGIVIVVLLMSANYRRMADFAPYIYLFFMALLVATLFVGRVVNGARSWIPIFDFGLQPSEFAKIATILQLAYHIDRNRRESATFLSFATALALVLIPMALILLQPDMGTALVYIPILVAMTYVGGYPTRYVLFLLCSGLLLIVLGVLPAWQDSIAERDYVLIGLLTSSKYLLITLVALFAIVAISAVGFYVLRKRYFYWFFYVSSLVGSALAGSFVLRRFLKEYQITRLIVFLDPDIDPRGAGWNVIQSVTAVGSGGLFGKGWLKGTQSHYRFLPQQSTDFIFSIIAEEWGFIGSLAVFALFSIILGRGFAIMLNARDRYAALVGAGIVGMIGFHVLINIGMAMGIMPITGIPLFFLSYGGSSLWTGLIGIGLLMSIHLRRYRY